MTSINRLVRSRGFESCTHNQGVTSDQESTPSEREPVDMDPRHTEVIAIHDHNVSATTDIDVPVPPADPLCRYTSHVVPLIQTEGQSPICFRSDSNTTLDIDGSKPCSAQFCPANSIQLVPESTVAQPLYVLSSYPSLYIAPW